jgi:hypothetical protein
MALSITALLGLMGLVVDVGWSYWRKLACKTAAQSASMAAVKAAGTTYTAQSSISCASLSSGPLYVGCEYANANGFSPGGGYGGSQTVMMAAGTSSLPVSGISNYSYWVTATVSEHLPLWFGSVLGTSAMTASIRSTAVVLPTPTGGGCIYALATSGTAIYESGGGALTSGCGVYANSNSDSGTTPSINLQPSSSLTATGGSKIYIATGGGYICGSGLNGSCVDGSSMSPMPTSAAAVSDPLAASLPTPPSTGSCTSFSIPSYEVGGLPYVLSPGTYCSLVEVAGSETLQLTTGTYVFEAGIEATASGAITATGPVTMYLTGGGITVSGDASITLSAPATGTYSGILAWQPASNTTVTSLGGSGSMSLSGILYEPGAQFNYSGASTTWGNVSIIAKSYSLTGSAKITSPATSSLLTGGGPPAGNYLIE